MSEQPQPQGDDEVYDLDADFQAVRRRPFRFRWGGQQWELPHFSEIDFRAVGLFDEVESLADKDEVAAVDIDILRKIFSYAFDPVQRARWEEQWQPMPAIGRLFSHWQKWSGDDLGESSGSTDSSKSTAEPSKRTSTGGTASSSKGRSTARRARG